MNKHLIKKRYYIEPNLVNSGWILRKEGSGIIVKKGKYKNMLVCFAEYILSSEKAELRICDSNGMLEDIVNF